MPLSRLTMKILIVVAVAAFAGVPAVAQVKKAEVPGITNFSRVDATVGCGGATQPSLQQRDPLTRESIEGNTAGVVIAAGRLDQTEGSGPGQLFAFDVAREMHGHLEDDVLDQWQVLFDESGEILRRHFAHE